MFVEYSRSINIGKQEDIISQGKQMGALAAPLHSTISDGAYMVMATLVLGV